MYTHRFDSKVQFYRTDIGKSVCPGRRKRTRLHCTFSRTKPATPWSWTRSGRGPCVWRTEHCPPSPLRSNRQTSVRCLFQTLWSCPLPNRFLRKQSSLYRYVVLCTLEILLVGILYTKLLIGFIIVYGIEIRKYAVPCRFSVTFFLFLFLLRRTG